MKYSNQAWFWTKNNQIIHELISKPQVHFDDVLVQIKAVGICGTDLGIMNGKNPNAKPPLPLGHEIAGVVVECGKSAVRLKPGDRVFLDPFIGCGQCDVCLHPYNKFSFQPGKVTPGDSTGLQFKSGEVILSTSNGFLPGEEMPKMSFYFYLALAYTGLLAFWGVQCSTWAGVLFRVHSYITTVILAGLVEAVC